MHARSGQAMEARAPWRSGTSVTLACGAARTRGPTTASCMEKGGLLDEPRGLEYLLVLLCELRGRELGRAWVLPTLALVDLEQHLRDVLRAAPSALGLVERNRLLHTLWFRLKITSSALAAGGTRMRRSSANASFQSRPRPAALLRTRSCSAWFVP